MTIKPLDIATLEKKAGNIYEAIVITAKRARQINDEQKIEYNQRLQPIMEKEEEDKP
jgi:DNA-directed RNA polymerase omega subunit